MAKKTFSCEKVQFLFYTAKLSVDNLYCLLDNLASAFMHQKIPKAQGQLRFFSAVIVFT